MTKVADQPGVAEYLHRQVAISVRILNKVILVSAIGDKKVFKWKEFHSERAGISRLDLSENLHSDRQVLGIRIVNTCPVTGSFIFPLFVETQGIDSAEKGAEKIRERQGLGIVNDPDCLGVAGGVGIDLLIGRGRGVAVGETDFGVHHTVNIPEIVLGTPEATAGEIYLFHYLSSSFSIDSLIERK